MRFFAGIFFVNYCNNGRWLFAGNVKKCEFMKF